MCVYFVTILCVGRFGLGWAQNVFKFACHMFMHFLAFVTFKFLYSYILSCWCFSNYLSLSLPLSLSYVSQLYGTQTQIYSIPEPSSFWGHRILLLTLHLLMYGSVMIKPERTFRRTFLDEAFIWNTKSSYWVSPILTYPLSFTIGVGGHYVTSQSLVPLWSYKSFTPICMDLILLYLISSLAFVVCT